MEKLLLAFAKLAFFVGIWTAGATLACAQDIQLPSGWRMPTSSELESGWRNRDPTKYAIVKGDFNGDGIDDQAMLLVSTRQQGFALFAFLSQERQKFKTYKLDSNRDLSFLQVTGITKVSPGTYRSACGKGYWACKAGEPSEVSIKYESIEYFREESAASYIHWDQGRKQFRRIWISD
jgi:hypothetical protein